MLKSILTSILITLSLIAFGQKNVVKVNPLSAIFRTINLSYERALGEKTSIQIGSFGTFWSFGRDENKVTFTGVSVTPEFRYYVTKPNAPEGFYVGPWIRYTHLIVTGTEHDSNNDTYEGKVVLNNVKGGAMIGYQFLFGDVVTLDQFLGFGGGYSNSVVKEGDEDSSFDYRIFGGGFAFRWGLTLGVAFGKEKLPQGL